VPPSAAPRLATTLLRAAGGSAALTLTGVAILLVSPLGPDLLVPGESSSPHAAFGADCGACHVASKTATKGILQGLSSSALSLEESGKCRACHAMGNDGLQAHGLPPHALAERTRSAERAVLEPGARRAATRALLHPPRSPSGEYACSLCHHEHRGSGADLEAVSDSRCQGCHVVRIDRFAHGHSDFDGYPYERRLRIIFDHRSHIRKHFLARDTGPAPDACTDCHSPDASGRNMLSMGFEDSCGGACHGAEVEGLGRVGETGVPVLALPALDTLTLAANGIAIGQWPADSAISEGTLTPFMELLLASDRQVGRDLDQIAGLDLLDLSEANGNELAAVGRLAWAVKSLLADIAAGGHEALRARLETVLGREVSTPELSALAGALPQAALREIQERWLPRLPLELRERAVGVAHEFDPMEDAVFEPGESVVEDWVSSGGWYRNDLDFSLRYRPRGHRDEFLRSWLDLAARTSQTPGVRGAAATFAALADPEAVGRCTKCHSIDDTRSGAVLNWVAAPRDSDARGLVKFSHEAHFPLLDERGCQTCHGLATSSSAFLDAYAERDPTVFTSVFQPLDKDACIDCHSPVSAGTGCLTCHEYHAPRPRTVMPDAPLRLPVP